MFTGICLSTGVVHGSEGCMVPEGAWSWGCMVLGVNGPGGPAPGGCLVETPQLLLRAVRILLECILVVECQPPGFRQMPRLHNEHV